MTVRRIRTLLITLLLLPCALQVTWAQTNDGPSNGGENGVSSSGAPLMRLCQDSCAMTALPVVEGISIDGVLDEAIWQTATYATGFRQFSPNEGEPSSQRTEVRILYGPTSLYVGATLHDDEPDKIMRTLGRRDQYSQADWFVVAIDSYFDRKTAYNFAVSAAGVQADGILSDGGSRRGGSRFGFDASWDAVWFSDVRVTDTGWSVELNIPYSMLRFSEADIQQWGVNFRRMIPRSSETSEWSLVRRTELESGRVAQFGILDGLVNIKPRRNIQITPYTVSRLQTEEGDPGQVHRTREFDFGGDLKIGLSPNVTLDATINPDFGQVESDPAELNLTAFETFFQERRPFFIEGVQIFRFPLDFGADLLYTRRIGSSNPIIGASKLSGRTNRGLSFGVLGAATGDNFDPNRYYGVFRLKQEIGTISSIGGMVTAFERTSATGSPRRSLAGGTDWDIRFKNNTYKLAGQASMTHISEPDGDVSSQTGYAFSTDFDKVRGIWNYSTGLSVITDTFNPNDLGRMRRNNYVSANVGLSHQINGGSPFGNFQQASVRLWASNDWSYDKLLNMGFGFFFFTDWLTRGFREISFNSRADYLFGGYDIYETRGLGPRAQPFEISFDLEYETDTRRTWQLEPGISYEVRSDGSQQYGVELETSWNVSSRLSLSVEVGYGWEDQYVAWASNESFVRAPNTWAIGIESGPPSDVEEDYHPFDDQGQLDPILSKVEPDSEGRFYVPVFGKRDTHTADFTLRSSVALSPTLSIQFYGQLFAARGQYGDFSILQNPETLAPFSAYPKLHDFAFNSFQTNLVFRWEYRPGSTLFLVWSQSRRGNEDLDPFDLTLRSPYDINTPEHLLDTFDIYPTNVFLIKLSYKFLR